MNGSMMNKHVFDSVMTISVIFPNIGSSSQRVQITTVPSEYLVPLNSANDTLQEFVSIINQQLN